MTRLALSAAVAALALSAACAPAASEVSSGGLAIDTSAPGADDEEQGATNDQPDFERDQVHFIDVMPTIDCADEQYAELGACQLDLADGPKVDERACPSASPMQRLRDPALDALLVGCDRWSEVGPFTYVLAQELSLDGQDSDPLRIESFVVAEQVESANIEGRPVEGGPTMLSSYHLAARLLTHPDMEAEVDIDANTGAIVEIAMANDETGGWNLLTYEVVAIWAELPEDSPVVY